MPSRSRGCGCCPRRFGRRRQSTSLFVLEPPSSVQSTRKDNHERIEGEKKDAHPVRHDPARAPGEHRAIRRDERPARPTTRTDPAPARQSPPARGPLEHVQPALPRAHLCRQIRHRRARAATRPGACDEGAEARGGAEEEVRAARAIEGAGREHGRHVCRARGRWHRHRYRGWIDGGRDEGVARDALDGVPHDAGERWEERAAAARVRPARPLAAQLLVRGGRGVVRADCDSGQRVAAEQRSVRRDDVALLVPPQARCVNHYYYYYYLFLFLSPSPRSPSSHFAPSRQDPPSSVSEQLEPSFPPPLPPFFFAQSSTC